MSLFYDTLDDIMLLKPESVVNPWLKSMGRDGKHDVSDCIDRINEKIAKGNISHNHIEDDLEDVELENVQLTFNFN